MLPCAASPAASVCFFHLFPRMRAQVTGAHVLHTHGVSINIDMFIYITHTHTHTHEYERSRSQHRTITQTLNRQSSARNGEAYLSACA